MIEMKSQHEVLTRMQIFKDKSKSDSMTFKNFLLRMVVKDSRCKKSRNCLVGTARTLSLEQREVYLGKPSSSSHH